MAEVEIIKAEVAVSKEAYELGLALAKIALDVKKLAADGLSVADIPQVLATMMTPEVVAGIAGVEKIGAEYAANKPAFISAFVVAGAKIAEGLEG